MLLGLSLTRSFESHLGSFAHGDDGFKKKEHKVHFEPAAGAVLLISDCALSGANFHQVVTQVGQQCLRQTAVSSPERAFFLAAISICSRRSISL